MSTTAPLRSPQELYEDWERSHWVAQDVALARDAEQWAALGETERASSNVAYGTEFLRRAVTADPAMGEVVRARLLILGVDEGALAQYGLGAVTRRLKLVGVAP